ncbi:MAG: hypothetical protein HC904_16645 [Blastochloris sp.]|nr:hypothetical protein [Blastochloris sp.]
MEKGKKADGYEDIKGGTPVDFRFSPPSQVRLQLSELDVRFREAPWNLRRLLNRVDPLRPGLLLKSALFEILYGMPGELKGDQLRFSELMARMGQLVRPPSKEDGPEALVKWWNGFWDRFDRRLGLYEISSDQQIEFDAEGRRLGFQAHEGVKFKLRESPAGKIPYKYPILGVHDDSKDLASKHEEGGLAGGFAYPFESAALYEALWRNPVSLSGHVERLIFSALGAWGNQSAVFDEGRLKISAEVEMGRLSLLRVERIGRIGCLGNHARHVIIYQRSVAPTEQFASQQDALLGAPVLRKSREFIELIQPVRSYPDYPSANVMDASMLQGCRFNSRTIAVDSRWGEDVGPPKGPAWGWKVPLWRNTGTPDENYPKPQVDLLFAPTEPACPQVPGEVLDPEKLYFYTDTRAGTGSNPDQWPSVPDIDVDPYAFDTKQEEDEEEKNKKPTESKPVPALLDGSNSRFTLFVSTNGLGANLIAGRSAGAMTSVIKNVSISRGGVSKNESVGDVLQFPRLVDNAGAEIRQLLESNGSAFTKAQNLYKTVEDNNGEALKRIKDSLSNQFSDEIIKKKQLSCFAANFAQRRRVLLLLLIKLW